MLLLQASEEGVRVKRFFREVGVNALLNRLTDRLHLMLVLFQEPKAGPDDLAHGALAAFLNVLRAEFFEVIAQRDGCVVRHGDLRLKRTNYW